MPGSTSGRVASPVGAVMIESPVRRQKGQVVPYPDMQAMTDYCRSQGIHTHLDGARLYMMSAASGIAPREYAALFDTVYVSLYKYFGAPFGAVLAGDSHWIDGMYHTRRMFGGSLSSAYLAATLALQGAQGFEERFEKAMRKGRDLFKLLNSLDGIQVNEFEHGSNIFPVSLDDGVNPEAMTNALRRNDVHVYPPEDPEAGLTHDDKPHDSPPAQRDHPGSLRPRPAGVPYPALALQRSTESLGQVPRRRLTPPHAGTQLNGQNASVRNRRLGGSSPPIPTRPTCLLKLRWLIDVAIVLPGLSIEPLSRGTNKVEAGQSRPN